MARSKKEPGFWQTVVAEAQSSAEPVAAIAAKHGVTEGALRYHVYKAQRSSGPSRHSPILPVRVEGDARLFSVEMDGSLRLLFAEGCDPAYVAAVIAKLR
jgi:transposase-like protein